MLPSQVVRQFNHRAVAFVGWLIRGSKRYIQVIVNGVVYPVPEKTERKRSAIQAHLPFTLQNTDEVEVHGYRWLGGFSPVQVGGLYREIL